MGLKLASNLLALFVLTCSGATRGAQIAPDNLIRPADIPPLVPYHVAFRTSTGHDAAGTYIEDFDGYVQERATAAGLGDGWRAIVSTAAVPGEVGAINAKDHLAPLFSDLGNVPIYDQSGVRIANSFDDLWDGSIQAALITTEWGTPGINTYVWTGTKSDGTISAYPLGGTTPCTAARNVSEGSSHATNSQWIETGQSYACTEASYIFFYAMSDEFYWVPVPPVALLIALPLAWLIRKGGRA